jgi:hypothetical protein
MIITDNYIQAHSDFKGNSIDDEMLLEFAKYLYKKNLIKVESFYNEENDYNVIRLMGNFIQREIKDNKKNTLKETEEKLKDMGMPEPMKPWYKRIFD